jgi:hypothetical protein
MTNQHPITPPPELVQQWVDAYFGGTVAQDLANRAVQWGADTELEACCEWLSVPCPSYGRELRNARRPKPPSLKEQALAELERWAEDKYGLHKGLEVGLIRRALEALDD